MMARKGDIPDILLRKPSLLEFSTIEQKTSSGFEFIEAMATVYIG